MLHCVLRTTRLSQCFGTPDLWQGEDGAKRILIWFHVQQFWSLHCLVVSISFVFLLWSLVVVLFVSSSLFRSSHRCFILLAVFFSVVGVGCCRLCFMLLFWSLHRCVASVSVYGKYVIYRIIILINYSTIFTCITTGHEPVFSSCAPPLFLSPTL